MPLWFLIVALLLLTWIGWQLGRIVQNLAVLWESHERLRQELDPIVEYVRCENDQREADELMAQEHERLAREEIDKK